MRDYGFGDFLRDMRVRRGLSQHQLGALVGVSGKAVSKWENGISKPHSRILFTLGEILGVTVDELLAGESRSGGDSSLKSISSMKKRLWKEAEKKLHEKYGETPDVRVMSRWMSEVREFERSDAVIVFELARRINSAARELGGRVRMPDMYTSFAAYIMGSSEINPLQPHYFCPDCGKIEFPDGVACCWDLPVKHCACGREFVRDGHGIPVESHSNLLMVGSWLHVLLPSYLWKNIREVSIEYFEGRKVVFLRRNGMEDFERMVFLPEDYPGFSCGDVLALDSYIGAFFEYPNVSVHVYDSPYLLPDLERETNTSFERIPYQSPELLDAFLCGDSDGIPDFGTPYIQQVMRQAKCRTYADLMKVMGLTHGTGVYLDNAEELIASGMPVGKVIAFREDIFSYVQECMKKNGIGDNGFAYRVMYDASRGVYLKSGLPEDIRHGLLAIGAEEWFIESISKLRWVFPRSEGAYFMKYTLIFMWYKQNFPEIFHGIMMESNKSE